MQTTPLEIQGMLDMMPDAILLVGENGIIAACNKQVEKLLGYQASELVHQPVEVLMPEKFREKHKQHVHQYFQHQSMRKMGIGLRLWAQKKDYSQVDVDIALSPFADGTNKFVIAVMREIADKMILEQKIVSLERMKDELERFAYVVSHDLKAPLHRIKMLVNLITLEIPEHSSSDFGQMVGYLHQSVDTIDKLIHGILDYTRVGAEEQVSWVDLNEVLSEARSAIVQPDYFSISLLHALPVVPGNRTKLMQIFLNLITNAIKYNKHASGVLQIDCTAQDDFFEFSFADNGTVVPPEKREEIFKLFTRAANDNDKASHGIGLSIVKKITEQAGGKIIYAESALGGSEFRFTWPKAGHFKTIAHSG